MVCRNCGNEMQPGAKFCPHCGAMSGADAGAGLPQGTGPSPVWEGSTGDGKKKTGLILGGLVAMVAVIALLVVAVNGLFTSPKQRLEKAMDKSFAAYARAEEALGLPDLSRLAKQRSVSQRMSLQLTDLNTAVTGYDLSALEGLGLRLQSDLEVADRKLGMELAAFWDDRELLSVQLAVDDVQVCLASPQFTAGEFYGVNTQTLGEDLKKMGVQDAGDVSFNFFDLVELAAPEGRMEELRQAVKQANQAIFDAAQVEKGGRESLFVNGTETKTDVYQVTVPKDAMKNYVRTVCNALADVEDGKLYEEIFRAMGMSSEALEELLGELEELDPYGDLADSLEEFLDELGDVELRVYVSGGYVFAARYEGHMSDGGALVELALYLGGGGEYVDNLRLEADVDGQKITLDSSGDHSCKSGVFTDETTLRGPLTTLSSKLRYEPGKAQDNFSWDLSVPGAGSLEMAGQFTPGEESVDLRLDELCLKVLGMKLCSLEMEYFVGPCEGQSVTASDPRLIGEMDSLALITAAMDLQSNAQAWLEEMRELLISRLPSGLLWAMTGVY